MEFLPFAVPFVVSLLALFVVGVFAQRSTDTTASRAVTPRTLWSTVVRGNEVLAPTTPYADFARRR